MQKTEGIEIPDSLRSLVAPPEQNPDRSESIVAFYEQLEAFAKGTKVQPGDQEISFIDSNVSGLTNVHHSWELGSWEDARNIADQLIAPLQDRFGKDPSELSTEDLLSQQRMVLGGLKATRRLIGEILGERVDYDQFLAEVLGVGYYDFDDELIQEARREPARSLALINKRDECYNEFDLERVVPDYRTGHRLGIPTLMEEVLKTAESTTGIMGEYVDLASLPAIFRSPREVIQFVYERETSRRMSAATENGKPIMKVNLARQITTGEGELLGGCHEWIHILELGMLEEYIKREKVLPELGVLLSYEPQLIYGEGIAQTNRLFLSGISKAMSKHAHFAAEWRYVRDLALLKASYIIHREFAGQLLEGSRSALRYLEPRLRPFASRDYIQMEINSIARTIHGKSYGGPVYGASAFDLSGMAEVLGNDDNRGKFVTLTLGLPVMREQLWFITRELAAASTA